MDSNANTQEDLKQALLSQYTNLKQSQEMRKESLLKESAKILAGDGTVTITDEMTELGIAEEIQEMQFRAYILKKVEKLENRDDD